MTNTCQSIFHLPGSSDEWHVTRGVSAMKPGFGGELFGKKYPLCWVTKQSGNKIKTLPPQSHLCCLKERATLKMKPPLRKAETEIGEGQIPDNVVLDLDPARPEAYLEKSTSGLFGCISSSVPFLYVNQVEFGFC